MDFQTGHFADFEKFYIDSHFTLWASDSYFTDLGQDVRLRKTIQTLSVGQKIQEPCIESGTSRFQ